MAPCSRSMMRLAHCAIALVLAATKELHSEHRVILHYAQGTADEHLGGLRARPAVVRAQALPTLGMAVVSLVSAQETERLVEELREDGAVELAVLDTFVTAFAFMPDENPISADSAVVRDLKALQDMALPPACSAHPACHARGLVGDCCPTGDRTMLSCCSASGPDLVSFSTYHGTYLAADANGNVYQAPGDDVGVEGRWQIVSNGATVLGSSVVQSVSLRSHYGKYLACDDQGRVFAKQDMAQSLERFEISGNDNRTISLRSNFVLFMSAEDSGRVACDRAESSLWEQFQIKQWASPGQRFATDPDMNRLWGLHHWGGYDIDAPEAWEIWTGETGRGITVAVIDTGIDYTHEDLAEQMWVNPKEIPGNGIDDDENGYVDDIHGADFANEDGDPMDDQMHGTHCSGTIAGIGGNGLGVAGVTWRGVRLMALKFLAGDGSGRASDAIRALDYAVAHGAKIASNSWGGGGSNPALALAIAHAEREGLLFVAAAGNEGEDNDEVASYPANYDSDNVISVASTTFLGKLSGFSCYGKTTVDVAAPGSSIWSTVPGGGYKYLSGTSMATPHVSGLAALVWMYRPQLSMRQVKDIILQSTKKLASLEGKTTTGGLINAKNALEAAWGYEPPRPPVHHAQGIEFQDEDSRVNVYGGKVIVTAAKDESDIKYYQVYFMSGAGFQLEALGDPLPATGAETMELDLRGVNTTFTPSKYAKYLAVVTGGPSGENAACEGQGAPSVALVDYGLPAMGSRAATWSGDFDNRPGFVQGTLTVVRAKSEETITNYNIYWSKKTGDRGSLVGRMLAAGYREPECVGTCNVIDVSKAEGALRWSFSHEGGYGSGEEATIYTSGPGFVTITSFLTEPTLDSLTIGETELSGNLSELVPFVVPVDNGSVAIKWVSDDSVEGNGWSFHFEQLVNTGNFDVSSVKVDGEGFTIVPAYKEYEMEAFALFVEIPDLTTNPSMAASATVAAASSTAAARVPPAGQHRRLAEEVAEEIRGQAAEQPLKRPAVQRRGDPAQPEFWLPAQKASAPVLQPLAVAGPSEAARRYGLVRVAAELPRLAARAAAKREVRSALALILATELKVAGDARVRVSSATGDDATAAHAAVGFEVEAHGPDASATLDYVEAHLILLASGGDAAERLAAAVNTALTAAGLAMGEAPVQAPVWGSAEAGRGSPVVRLGPVQRLSAKTVTAAARPDDGGRRLRGVASEEPWLLA